MTNDIDELFIAQKTLDFWLATQTIYANLCDILIFTITYYLINLVTQNYLRETLICWTKCQEPN